MSGWMDHAPTTATKTRVEGFDVGGRDCQQRTWLSDSGNLFQVEMWCAKMLNRIPHTNHVKLPPAVIMQEKVSLYDVEAKLPASMQYTSVSDIDSLYQGKLITYFVKKESVGAAYFQ